MHWERASFKESRPEQIMDTVHAKALVDEDTKRRVRRSVGQHFTYWKRHICVSRLVRKLCLQELGRTIEQIRETIFHSSRVLRNQIIGSVVVFLVLLGIPPVAFRWIQSQNSNIPHKMCKGGGASPSIKKIWQSDGKFRGGGIKKSAKFCLRKSVKIHPNIQNQHSGTKA